jgi:hypothetical protein
LPLQLLLIWLFPLASWRKNDNPALLAFASSLIFALPSLRNASSPAVRTALFGSLRVVFFIEFYMDFVCSIESSLFVAMSCPFVPRLGIGFIPNTPSSPSLL